MNARRSRAVLWMITVVVIGYLAALTAYVATH